LGKDSVRWVKTIKLPSQVVDNLRSFIGKPREPVFSGVRSEMVNAFLGEVAPWLTAKVFRTYHASKVVRDHLAKAKVGPEDQDFEKKYAATMANLEAAITCNHKRKLPKNWEESLRKKEERLNALKAQLKEVRKKPPSKMRTKRINGLMKRIDAAEIKVKLAKATRDYNLGTSLRSYIDPRIYAKWAKEIGYDWKEIYPTALQRKFAWVEDSTAYK
jgi:DNA topoisomerase-1